MRQQAGELGAIARQWFEVMRRCGPEVREILHDGHPTACVADAAFGYVNAFRAHVNVGFFRGAELPDPEGLLEGTGKYLRHVKLRPGDEIKSAALKKLIATAYLDMQQRVHNESMPVRPLGTRGKKKTKHRTPSDCDSLSGSCSGQSDLPAATLCRKLL